MPNTIDDLREHLFATLDALRDKENPMEIERAKAISEVAQTVISSAKAEVDYLKALGRQDVALPVFGEHKTALPAPKEDGAANQSGVVGVRTHRIK